MIDPWFEFKTDLRRAMIEVTLTPLSGDGPYWFKATATELLEFAHEIERLVEDVGVYGLGDPPG